MIQIIFLYKILTSKKLVPKIRDIKKDINMSIIIPVYNEELNLDDFFINLFCINKKLELKYKFRNKIEFIIVNDRSTDKSLNIINFYKNIINKNLINSKYNNYSKYTYKIKVINCKTKCKNISSVLNIGCNNIDKESNFIGIINSDSIIEGRIIDDIIDELSSKQISVFNLNNLCKSSITKNIAMNSFYYILASYEKNFKNYIFTNLEACLSNGYFIDKDLLYKMKRFNEDEICEDLHLALKLNDFGYKIYQSDKFIYDDYPNNLKDLFNQKYRWIYGDISNRLNIIPLSVYDIMVNIYYLLPIFFIINIIIYHISYINILYTNNIDLLYFNNLLLELLLHIRSGNGLIFSIITIIIQILYMVYFLFKTILVNIFRLFNA